ncbi:MAG: NACHT domain-containing protein [Leptolyngbyaceae cyanobacterium RU_5_1]|nr:NACHT domain-containing protein [Leptolyngbyaceae cyanobacterium RU_5_1]
MVSLAEALHTWLANPDRDDAIRVICGGPGCGKSSFTRILAAKLAEQGHLPVLVVPLHQLELEADLVEAIATLIRTDPDRLLPPNPLEPNHAEPRLLLIFDGLDELAMQGKVGNEAAQQFVREVQKLVNRFNQRTPRLQVLLSGRDLSVQANSTEFRREGQILHILPYFVPEDQWESYEDDQKLLADDRRQFWWKQYGTVSDRGYIGLPTELQHDNLTEITAQPLLNYLVALSYRREHLNFAETSNLNQIYADLLDAIYERAWAGYQHPTLQNVSRENFGRILEEIALSSWHGDGRTTTVQDIEKHCDSSGLKKLLEVFQEGAKTGVTRLLTAFYFRQSGSLRDGDKTFEFTHKSFGEYLTARRIIRGIARIATELDSHQQDLDRGWDERDALAHWAALCGASEMDVYLFNFVCNEMQLHDPDQVARWQQVLAHLFGVMLRQGMPMERLTPRPDYHEENRQARHAEESLLAVLNACARHTNQPSKIEHPSPEAFGAWLVRIQGQRMGGENVLALSCLGFLNLENCILMGRDLDGAILDRAILDRAILDRAILDGAILDGAGLAYISWNAETSWRNVQGLKTAKKCASRIATTAWSAAIQE